MYVCFVLPVFTRKPQGGYKMAFEYANRLHQRGHQVSLLFMNEDALDQYRLPGVIRHLAANVITQIEPRWFALDKGIKKYSDKALAYRVALRGVDTVVATGIETVEHLNTTFRAVKNKAYFIQGYENWNHSDEYVRKTYGMGFKNIVISKWLKGIVDEYDRNGSTIIRNPIDTGIYRMMVPQENRAPHTIGLLYHEAPQKGLKYAFMALDRLKSKYADLVVEMFGIPVRPDHLPDWIHYTQGASTEQTIEIYNKVQVFLCATVEEGYGLTGLEAMACGAVLVSTAYIGVKEYANHNDNALLSPVKDVDALTANVCSVFEDKALRMRLAEAGARAAKQFDWDGAVDQFEQILLRDDNR